jgi:hypothetical protein
MMTNECYEKEFVKSDILKDVKKEITNNLCCACDDYENCDYENRD